MKQRDFAPLSGYMRFRRGDSAHEGERALRALYPGRPENLNRRAS